MNKKKLNPIWALRNSKHITIPQLCKETGINQKTIEKYETNFNNPVLENLITLANFFEVSIDFLLQQNDCPYPKSTKLLSLGEKIDKLNELKRFQITSNCQILIGENNLSNPQEIKIDDSSIKLGNNLHQNIKIVREKREVLQTQLAELLGIAQSSVANYEKDIVPVPKKFIKLSSALNVSIHYLSTGKPLYFQFRNTDFGKILLQADAVLDLKDKEILIELMERTIK